MGRTLPSFSQVFQMEQNGLKKFRGALSRTDQRLFDQLWDAAHFHTAAMAYAADPLPMRMILLSMLLEQHKIVMQLEKTLEELKLKKMKSGKLNKELPE